VALRGLEESDISALIIACRDPEIPRYTRVPSPYSPTQARDFIRGAEADRISGAAMHAAITETPSSDLVGMISVHAIDRSNLRAEIGYWLAAEVRGRGLAARAVRLLSDLAFETLDLERVTIFAEPENVASRRVAEAAGFFPEGELRSWLNVGGRQRDAIVHCRLRNNRSR